MTNINNKLSRFQIELNNLTFYLFLLSIKCKNIKNYDDDGDFKNHYFYFYKILNLKKDLITNDKNLLINQPPFNEYFKLLEINYEMNSEKKINKLYKKEYRQKIIDLFFQYSFNIQKSKIRDKATIYKNWSIFFILIFFFLEIFLISKNYSFFINKIIKINFNSLFPYILILILLFISIYYFVESILINKALKSKNNSELKFNKLYSNNYCYDRIKAAEFFFKFIYKVENEYKELSEIEKLYPKENNLFYNTIKKAEKNNPNIQMKKLLNFNNNIYLRVVFSDLFELIKKDEITELQQMPFFYTEVLTRAKINMQGNTAFSYCLNEITEKYLYSPESFNQGIHKYKSIYDIGEKYLKIIENNENIFQSINISYNM